MWFPNFASDNVAQSIALKAVSNVDNWYENQSDYENERKFHLLSCDSTRTISARIICSAESMEVLLWKTTDDVATFWWLVVLQSFDACPPDILHGLRSRNQNCHPSVPPNTWRNYLILCHWNARCVEWMHNLFPCRISSTTSTVSSSDTCPRMNCEQWESRVRRRRRERCRVSLLI
jgi:hypothetical protein